MYVNWFLQNLSINLPFASNNSSIVWNSNTIANKEKIPRLEFLKSLDVPNNDQRLVETWNTNMTKSSNGVSLNQKKRTCNNVTHFQVEESGLFR